MSEVCSREAGLEDACTADLQVNKAPILPSRRFHPFWVQGCLFSKEGGSTQASPGDSPSKGGGGSARRRTEGSEHSAVEGPSGCRLLELMEGRSRGSQPAGPPAAVPVD